LLTRPTNTFPVRSAALTGLLCAVVATGCGGGSASVAPSAPLPVSTPNGHVDWATFGFDATRSGKNPNEATLGAGNVGALQLRWTFSAAGAIAAQPIVAANVPIAGSLVDVLYVGDEAGDFYALSAASGAPIWRRTFAVSQNACLDLPSWGITATAVLDRSQNAVYVVDGRGAAHGLDLSTGANLARWPGSVSIVRDPSVEYAYSALARSPSGAIIAAIAGYCDSGTYYGGLVALDAATGAMSATWVPQVAPNYGNGIWGAGGVAADPRPGVSDVYVGTGNAFPEAATYSNSVVRLSANLQPVATDSQFEGGAYADNDFGANPVTYAAAGCPPQLAVEQKAGYLDLYELDAIAAGPVQRVRIGTYSAVTPNVDSASYDAATSLLYIGNATSNVPYGQGLLAFSFVGCRLQLAWQQPGIAPSPLSQPVIANGVVYYATGLGGTVAAYDAVTGRPLWNSATFGGAAFAAPTVVNGMLYATSFDRHVYAYGLGSGAAGHGRRLGGLRTGVPASSGAGRVRVTRPSAANLTRRP
jgi:outer membrane protein assembly factor BamB